MGRNTEIRKKKKVGRNTEIRKKKKVRVLWRGVGEGARTGRISEDYWAVHLLHKWNADVSCWLGRRQLRVRKTSAVG